MNILFYDGPCALCNYTVKMILKIEDTSKVDKLYFASIQSETAHKMLEEKLRTPPLTGVILIENARSVKIGYDAVKALKPYLQTRWSFLILLFGKNTYSLIAKFRYLSGTIDNVSCPISINHSKRVLP